MCNVINLRETDLVSQVKLRLHTMLPTVLTVEPSARVTTRRSLAAVGVRSASCLAVASLAEVGEQTTSVNETVDGNREDWGGHSSYDTQD